MDGRERKAMMGYQVFDIDDIKKTPKESYCYTGYMVEEAVVLFSEKIGRDFEGDIFVYKGIVMLVDYDWIRWINDKRNGVLEEDE